MEKLFPKSQFGLITLHRPSNVDDLSRLETLMTMLNEISNSIPLIFPVHPRTRSKLDQIQFVASPNLHLREPMRYMAFLGLLKNARLVVTDSGGIQEETSYLDVPCVTARDNTERPITVSSGSNVLAGSDPDKIAAACYQQLENPKHSTSIPLWDGHAAKRIVEILTR